MDVVDLSTSQRHAIQVAMERLYDENPEGWARIRGLMAMLALPPVRAPDGTYHRPRIEAFIDGAWQPVDEVAIEADAVTFAYGSNGTRREWRFDPTHCVPQWRVVRRVHERFDVGGDS